MDTDNDLDSILRQTMAELTQQFAHPQAIDAAVKHVTTAAVDLIPAVASADVLEILGPDDYRSFGATSELAEKVSRIQQEVGEGPCLEAASHDSIVRSADLRRESRWPAFAEAAVATGIASLMSFQLYTHDKRRAALNLYGARPDSFSDEEEATAGMLATQAANAFIAQDKELQFRSALASRDIIGQAKGVLMERFDIDAVQAFDLMKRLSQQSNTRITDVAADIVDHRGHRRSPLK